MDHGQVAWTTTGDGTVVLGAYGLAIDLVGITAAPGLMAAPQDAAITVRHLVDPDHAPVETATLSADAMHYPFLVGGRLDMIRADRTAVVTTPGPVDPNDLVHPYLSPIGGMWARWMGREPFHCSAAVFGGRVWGILGPREAGKSTLVAWLATHDVAIMTDDLLVVDVVEGEPIAYAGPRSVDLREPTAVMLQERMGAAIDLTPVRARERWRLAVADVPWALPMGGWFILGEADDVQIERVGPAERLSVLADHRMVQLEVQDAVQWMDLAMLPTYRVSRPKHWDRLPEVVAAMQQAAASNARVSGG